MKLKLTCIKTSPTTVQQRDTTKKKKTPIKKSQILSNIISTIFTTTCTILTTIQLFKLTTETHTHEKKKEVEAKRRSWSIQTKDEEISSPSKLFHGAPFTYFPGTCINRFYSNLISKSRSHLKFAVTLSFYVVFLGLTSRNYLLSPKLNHGLSLRKYYIFENKLYMSAKYLYLEEYIL